MAVISTRRLSQLSLSTWVLVGLIAGIAVGLFVGEECASLQVVGDVYVGLLQMTVLPYIVVSLIVNLGKLDMASCKRLAAAAAGVLCALWLLMSMLLLILPMALPEWRAGGFFSTSMLEAPAAINLQELFIPTNPFHSLAANLIPATVLFSICVGVALIGVENKQPLLDILQILLKALGRINHTVALSSPVGVFAIMAATAGTITLDQFARLQAYLLIYLLGTFLSALLILPLLVTSTTPIRYPAFLRAAWAPMLTAFATGKTLVVLPMIADGVTRLLEDSGVGESPAAKPGALVALAYPFPHLGKLISLLFIPFAAWFSGAPMPWSDYPGFLAAGIVSMFGNTLASILFLLDLEQLPADSFQLFLGSGVICSRLGDLLGAVSLLAFAILTSCALEGRLRLRLGALAVRSAVGLALVLLCVGASRAILEPLVRNQPSKDQVLLSMHTAVVRVPHEEAPTTPEASPTDAGLTRLARIKQRGVLRVGCFLDNIPFSFRNEAGELVGFDIDMAHLLAADLDCKLLLVPLTPEQLLPELAAHKIDLAMCGILMTTDRLQAATFTKPYMRVTMSLMVPDYRRREFSSLGDIRRMAQLRVAAMPAQRLAQKLFPDAEIVTIQSPREFFADQTSADAMLISAEAGSAWTLMYPGFTPVVLQPETVRIPLGYPVAGGDREFAEFVSQWIELESASAEFRQMYEYWILGRGTEKKEPRWSILRNVFGWSP